MKQEEPQIHGKYWRHETGGRYKQEKTEYRACRGDSWDREKSRAIQKVPCGEESGGDAEREKEWGKKKASSGKGTAKGIRKPKPRQPGAGAGGEKWYRGIYGNGSGDYCIICNIGTFVFEQFRALRLCRKFSAINSAWRIRRDGVSVPFLLFMGTCFYLSNRGNQKAVAKLVAVGEVLLAFCGLSQLLMGGGQHLDWNLGDYYAQAGGGGFIGGILMRLLCGTVGTIGAVLILLVLLALGAVCITERSLVNFVKQGSGRAYEYAKEDMSRRREIHEEKKEEKRRLREEQRVRGVDLEGAKLTELPVMRNFSEGVPEGTVLGPEDAPEEFREMHGRQENLQDEAAGL